MDTPDNTSHDFNAGHDPDTLGNIKIALNVVANIVRLAAFEVEGVLGVGSGFVDGLAEMFTSRQTSERGVKIEEPEAGVYDIEIRVVMQYGLELAKVAYELQSIVKERVSSMTGAQVKQVNVVIDGVRPLTEKPTDRKVEFPIKSLPAQKTAEPEFT